MKRLAIRETIACAVLGCASIALIVRSIVFTYKYHFSVLFGDQWELVKALVHDEAATKSWRYLFEAHNEHVIASSKALFFLDLALFHLTNWPLVLSTILLAVLIAWLLAVLLFWGERHSKLFWMTWLIFAASGLSLAQWENLQWGFQPQFNLVLFGALVSILIALKVPAAEGPKGLAWLAALVLAMGFCVFSMGSGVAIPVSVIFLLILFRASLFKCLFAAACGAFYIATFFWLTRGGVSPGDAALKMPYNMVVFFFEMIGCPFTTDPHLAAITGAILFVTLSGLFTYALLIPWFRRRKSDPGLAGLFAMAGFLFASAAAAAWARTALGAGAAMSSRYATPMLVLWMSLFAVLIRLFLTSRIFPSNERLRQVGLWLTVIVAFAAVSWSTFRSVNVDLAVGRVEAIHRAGYFIASGVLTPSELTELYPVPDAIMAPIAFLREHRLNMFAASMGLPLPPAHVVQVLASAKSIPSCILGSIDKTIRLDSESWELIGWISDQMRRRPQWILAADNAGRLLGFTAPLIPRRDIEAAIGAHRFRGFALPLRTLASSQRPYSIVAITDEGEAACQLSLRLAP
jgi:hypothetical protein